jgi:hypothetical protein
MLRKAQRCLRWDQQIVTDIRDARMEEKSRKQGRKEAAFDGRPRPGRGCSATDGWMDIHVCTF